MFVYWTSATLVGLFCGRLINTGAWRAEFSSIFFVILGFGASICLAKRYASLAKTFLLILGSAWGLAHAAPPPQPDDYLTVIATDVVDQRTGPVLAVTGKKLVESLGPRIIGCRGHAKTLPSKTLFHPHRTLFKSSISRCILHANSNMYQITIWGRSLFDQFNDHTPPLFRPWFRGFIAGDGSGFTEATKSIFLKTGLYHLLVVSGLHITVLTILVTSVFSLPFRIFYALRLLRSNHFCQLNSFISGAAVIVALIYCAVCGLSSATQRALLFYIADQIMKFFLGIPSIKLRAMAIFAAQLVFFPIGFLSEGTLMSWGAYLLISEAKFDGFFESMKPQFTLLGLTVAVFGQFPLLGVIANPLIVPIFPFLLISGLVYLVWPFGYLAHFFLSIQSTFLVMVRKISSLEYFLSWLFVPSSEMPTTIRGTCIVVSTCFLLNAWRNLSIRD